jgi:hypothetical protein
MPHEIATRRVLYEIPGMEAITPREFEFPGSDGQPLPGRIYLRDRAPGRLRRGFGADGVVVIVEGFPDPGFVKHVGCRFMDMQWSISMAQLIAASGTTAVTYANRQPAADAHAVIDYVTANIGSPVALWATSGHGPVGIAVLDRALCAVLWNPVTEGVRLSARVPVFVVRSGKDETPGLNPSLDQFLADAVARNHPITLVNHPEAPHSFELYDDSEDSRLILRQALEFLRDRLHT